MHLEDFFIINRWGFLKCPPLPIIEGPCPTNSHTHRGSLLEYLTHLPSGGVICCKHHQPWLIFPFCCSWKSKFRSSWYILLSFPFRSVCFLLQIFYFLTHHCVVLFHGSASYLKSTRVWVMRSIDRWCVPIVLCLLIAIRLVRADDFVPTDKILLNCGGPPDSTDGDGRKWTTDVGSKFTSSAENSTAASAATQDPEVPEVPYMTARVFHSEFTYSFPVAPGRKFIRLYFYPASYSSLNASNALFAVTSQSYTLLRNFSVSQTTEALNFAFIVKEYLINVEDNTLNVTFTPSKNGSNSYAFVNGIEIVSMPDIYSSTDGTTMIVGTQTPYTIDNSTALENVYRLNVGGNDISPSKDTGLFRSWYDDTPYLYGAAFGVTEPADPEVKIEYPPGTPTYIAPLDVYSTARSMGPDANVNQNYNLTWIFSIDTGFSYLVRLHFCEGTTNITKINQRVFQIFLYNQTAESPADVIAWAMEYGLTHSNGVPVHKDYVVFVPTGQPQQDLWVALHPDVADKPEIYDAILNGVEIFKIDSSGNLAGANPIPAPQQDKIDPSLARPSHGTSKNQAGIIGGGVGGGVVLLLVVGLFAFGVFRRRQGKDSSSSDGPSNWLPLSLYGNSHSAGSAKTNTTGSYASSLPSNLCRHFSFAEIQAATKNFDEALVLGVGGFGKVYKGEIDGGAMKVAIKRGNPLSEQGVHEFQTEIEMLSKLRHRHLVSLIGYCEENCEMILVYDYMAHGTLREHLYKTQKPPLPWKQRLEICIGAARGLHYLHTGAKHTIIHRDVKTTNILLDDKWVAKVSDFGLSKTGPSLDNTHVSTVVKGSFGYLDPEYFRRQQLTEKSDVYSFGVVLFEILCARPALNPTLPKEQVSLAEWASHCQKKGILDQILDPFLKGKIAPECFKKFAETAMKCVADQGIDRPSMGDVLWNLEFALQLQESAGENNGKGFVGSEEDQPLCEEDSKGKKDTNGFEGNVSDSRSSGISMSIGGRSLASEDSDGLTPSAVFSQIMNPKGR
ncbi:receptor-like protein kinase FERONIA [Senna tora]|uniref:non-specific serine/threonine protein kinase n=1 Tax=Senna tora TaxID=362788 RepID=A0A834XJ58_9FABA|nr:receptor-like protein kinase FERONIA [Senna tora]